MRKLNVGDRVIRRIPAKIKVNPKFRVQHGVVTAVETHDGMFGYLIRFDHELVSADRLPYFYAHKGDFLEEEKSK